jgi:hypothetical protein
MGDCTMVLSLAAEKNAGREQLDRYGKDLDWWDDITKKLKKHNALRAEQDRNGRTDTWQVASKYWIENGRVMEGGNPQKVRTYLVNAFPELAGRLADLADGNDKAVLAFCGEFGRLGYDKMTLNDEPGEAGEPVSWIKAHATTVKMLLEVIHLPEENTGEYFADYVRSHLVMLEDFESNEVGTFLLVPGLGLALHAAWEGSRDGAYHPLIGPLDTKEQILDNLVALVLQDNCRGLRAFPIRAGWVRAHDSLLAGIYGHLAEVMIGNLVYYKCAYRNCGKWNPITTEGSGSRPRYCPTKGQRNSHCARKETYYRAKDLAKAHAEASAPTP